MSFFNGSGQKVDSLKALLISSQGNSLKDRFDILYGLAYELFDVNNDEAILYSNQSYTLAHELGDSLKIVRSGRLNGQLLRRLGKLNESASILRDLLPIASRNNFLDEKKKILNALAIAFTFLANYDKALEYHFESLMIREREGDKAMIATALANIGLVYYKLTNFEEAIKYFLKSVQLKKEVNDKFDLDRLLINIGLCYTQLGDFIKAKQYFDSGFEVCGETCSNIIIIEGNFGLGLLNFKQGNYNEALEYFQDSYNKSKESQNTRFQCETLIQIARIEILKENNRSAIQKFEEAEALAYNYRYNELALSIYENFLMLYNKLGQFKKLSSYQQKYIQLKDSIYNKELTANLMKMESAYQTRESQAQLASQKQILILKEDSIRTQRKLNITISLVALCLVVIAITLFRSNSQRKSINVLLELKVKERTKELEQNRNELLRSINERDVLIEKTAQDIRSSLATIKGICAIGQNDITDATALEYIRQVDHTSNGLSHNLLMLQNLFSK